MSRMMQRSLLLLLVLTLVMILPQTMAANNDNKKVYEVAFATETLSTPMDWVNSPYFNNPQYKETRFVNYGTGTVIVPGGPRETSFYMVYKEDGVYLFVQSNETETDASGALKNSWLELFVQTGVGDEPYHQMIVPTNGEAIDYYEWQTEYRHNRPLKGFVQVQTGQIPTGWGTVIMIPWEAVYDAMPLNGESWSFNLIRWSPSVSPSWGGNVHQPGAFNHLKFQLPTSEQRKAIQKYSILKAWEKFMATNGALTSTWQTNGDSTDRDFFTRHLQSLIGDGLNAGAGIDQLDQMSAEEINALWSHVSTWTELRYDAEDERSIYLKKLLMSAPTPVTSISLDPSAPNGTNGWYTSDVSVSLSASGGAARTEYRLNGGAWQTYAEPFLVSQEGTHVLEARSFNASGDAEETKSVTLMIDKTKPSITIKANNEKLWPPNHKLMPIEVDVQHNDSGSGVASFELTSITSNEPDNGQDDDDTTGDIANAEYGTPDTSFSLRAERASGGDGRIYTITYTVFDVAGNKSEATATVIVPKNNNHHDEDDDV